MVNVISKTGRFSAQCLCSNCEKEYAVKNVYDAKKSPIGDICGECKTLVSGMTEPTQELLNKAFVYEPNTGKLKYKTNTISGMRGDICTYDHSGGYLSVCVGRKQLLAHRVIYMMVTGDWPEHIDHKNHNKKDNRWVNIRSVAQSINNKNMPLQANNTSGFTGVSLNKKSGKWLACITIDSKWTYLGSFDSFEEAVVARKAANTKYGYHDNHGV